MIKIFGVDIRICFTCGDLCQSDEPCACIKAVSFLSMFHALPDMRMKCVQCAMLAYPRFYFGGQQYCELHYHRVKGDDHFGDW